MNFCAGCGQELNPKWVVCPNCGVKLLFSNTSQTEDLPSNEIRGDKLVSNKTAMGFKIPLLAVLVAGIIVLATTLITDEGYSLEYSHANAHILIYSLEVDNGEDNRMFEVDVYYDELNRNEFQTGYECDALEYYSSPRTYYLDEFCTIYFADPFVDEVTFGACAQYVASERYYDISGSGGAACVKGQGAILNPKIEPSDGLEESCTSQGEIVADDLRSAKFVTWSGLDDGDSNAYNAEITFSLSFVLYYECK